jgi:hypothetical protein
VRKEFIPGNNNVYDSNGFFSGTSSCIADITGPNEKFCEGFNQKSDGLNYRNQTFTTQCSSELKEGITVGLKVGKIVHNNYCTRISV